MGATFLPCCAARLCGPASRPADYSVSLDRLALLWSERANALRFRRAVLRMTASSTEQILELARLQREAHAYDAGTVRLQGLRPTRIAWLVRLLLARRGDRVVGRTLGTMAAELAVMRLKAVT
jgi:hypothetical protein